MALWGWIEQDAHSLTFIPRSRVSGVSKDEVGVASQPLTPEPKGRARI